MKEDSGAFSCQPCASGYYPIGENGKCVACPIRMVYDTNVRKCECDSEYSLAGDICVPRDNDPSFINKIDYQNGENDQIAGSVVSNTLEQLQLKAAHICRTTLAKGNPDQ